MQTEAEKKIDFLMRFGPRLRDAGRRTLEEYEVFFQKERASCGYHLVKQGEQNDYIYLLFSGKARMLWLTKECMGEVLFPKSIKDVKTYFVLGDIKIGECFGE